MSTRRPRPPFIGSLSRVVWQWVRARIAEDVLAAGYDDLNPAHIAVFRFPSPEGMRPSELAAELQITKQSVHELLGHLESRGYIVREPDPTSKRSRRIRLTDRGRLLEDVVWRAAERAEHDAAALIGAERVRDLREALLALAQAVGGGANTTR